MCGIAGIVGGTQPWPGSGQGMSAALAHRGPDCQGFRELAQGQLLFYHTRLSILDTSPQSTQPFQLGHLTLVYNGELYNYEELRAELQQLGHRFGTTGDTEVLAAAFAQWGIACLERLDGMFAFALYDGRAQKLWLVRDRFGEKPLYFFARYGAGARLQYLLFASEMKALWAAGVPRQVNHKLMVNYLGLGMVQNPIVKTETFFQEILSLPPGYLLEADVPGCKLQMRRWYEPYKAIGHRDVSPGRDLPEVLEEFTQLLHTSVRRRLRSHVPVGTSLSGGLDSSSIVALIHMLRQQGQAAGGWANVAFSAIFPGFEKDEYAYSKQVAAQYGIRQYTVAPTAEQLAAQLATMMYHQEEPVQSSSVFSQYRVYAAAADMETTVLLDGQGADEVLGGYPRYSHWYLQQLLRSSVGSMLAAKKALQQNDMLEQWGWAHYAAAWLPWQAAKALQQKALRRLEQAPFHRAYMATYLDQHTLFKPAIRSLEDMLYFNTFNMGLEELLRYADRNSMAHSVEVRLPFLYHKLVEFVFSLPSAFKIQAGYGKWLLRKAMEPHLPPAITWRRGKVGHEPPQASWMQHPAMQALVQDARRQLVQEGILDAGYLSEPLQAYGAHALHNYDWRILSAASIL